jgi:Domain of unknown function (DUF5122) beta-propeller
MKADLREHTRRAKCLRRTVYLISLIAIFFEYRLAIAAEPLELDKTFDEDGKVTANIAQQTDDYGADAVIQPDGKIIVVGLAVKGPDVSTSTVALIRYNSDGTKDEGFGNLGVKTTLIGQDGSAWKVFLQPEGKNIGGRQRRWRFCSVALYP